MLQKQEISVGLIGHRAGIQTSSFTYSCTKEYIAVKDTGGQTTAWRFIIKSPLSTCFATWCWQWAVDFHDLFHGVNKDAFLLFELKKIIYLNILSTINCFFFNCAIFGFQVCKIKLHQDLVSCLRLPCSVVLSTLKQALSPSRSIKWYRQTG